MFELHAHSILSDGLFLPAELARRYKVLGYKYLVITDHVDSSNLDTIATSIIQFCRDYNTADVGIKVLPGVEITHVPCKQIQNLVNRARKLGICWVVVHGQTLVEPVCEHTNKYALKSGIDFLAHPGLISEADAKLAAQKGVFLEISGRTGHCFSNGHILNRARFSEAQVAYGSDTHSPSDIRPVDFILQILQAAGMSLQEAKNVVDLTGKRLERIYSQFNKVG